ncbi:hypothetical protein AR276_21270 [Stenotrophomonas maltophilia]|nr:hypothetical protein AR276_21270 [Stenotrophomonas maltophilia]
MVGCSGWAMMIKCRRLSLLRGGCVAGLLEVADDGQITLDLIGVLLDDGEDSFGLGLEEVGPRTIRGLLKGTGEHVLLTGARPIKMHYTDQISSQVMRATAALVSRHPITLSQFTELMMPLEGFEAWAYPGTVSGERPVGDDGQRHLLSLQLARDCDRVYETFLGQLTFQTDFGGCLPSYDSTSVDVSLKSQLVLRLSAHASLDQIRDYFRGFEDLILLLSNSSRSLPWPVAKSASVDGLVRIYYARANQNSAVFNRHQCWLSLARLGEDFGAVVNRWFERRRELGPGLHLFLGMRRPRPMYIEHKFANLVWGLESLHRRLYDGVAESNEKLRLKVERIMSVLSGVEWANASDKRYALGKFKNVEASLAERIEQLLLNIGLGFDNEKLREFSEKCADLRNDLSHYGGERTPGTYSDVIEGYVEFSIALGHLYHLLLLHLVGISDVHIHWLVNEHRDHVRHHLARVNLVPQMKTPSAS